MKVPHPCIGQLDHGHAARHLIPHDRADARRGEALERRSGRLGTRTLGEARIPFPQARDTNETSRSDQCTIGAAAGGAAVGGTAVGGAAVGGAAVGGVGVRGAGEPVVSGIGFPATFM